MAVEVTSAMRMYVYRLHVVPHFVEFFALQLEFLRRAQCVSVTMRTNPAAMP